ncbi:MAG TPA: efflux RND transporter periplasmic adaptor subunit, partial [Candidatus Competibacteraceae bacterium]|nr:efflux RND transporter periplasmic adaptor subunit [Candidatus Competibacteraceae bacterium]
MPSLASRPFLSARRRIAAVLVLFGASAVTLSGCGKSEANAPAAQMPPPEVARLTVAPRDVELPIEYVAQVAGSRQVEVRARVEGILLQRTYIEGRPVQAGDTLFVIDPAPFQAALEQARGNLAEQQARLAQAERDLKRVLALVADKALSQRDRDAAIAERDKAQAAVRAAQAAVREAEINLGYTKVTAPIAGITSKEVRSEGSLVRPGEDSGLLTTISQLDPAYVNFSYADNELLALRRAVAEGKVSMPEGQGLEVELRLADGSLYPHAGRVNFTDSVIDTGTGSVRARAEFPNPDAALLPGQFVRVRVKGVVRRNVVLVPQRAVMQAPNGKFVYLVGAENKVEMRSIETGAAIGKEWLVERGLGGG